LRKSTKGGRLTSNVTTVAHAVDITEINTGRKKICNFFIRIHAFPLFFSPLQSTNYKLISFPLNCCGGFAGNIVHHPPYLRHGVGYAGGYFQKIEGLKGVDIGGHAVGACNCP
jgi:hypothetical protein